MASEFSGINQSTDQALKDLAALRRFQGGSREFWDQYVDCVARLTGASKVAVLVRPAGRSPEALEEVAETGAAPSPGWRKIGEWVENGNPSRLLGTFTSQLPEVADSCVEKGSLSRPLAPVPARGNGHYAIAFQLILTRGNDACVVSCLVMDQSEAGAQEGLLRLGMVADVPASYQDSLASIQARTDVQKFASALDLTTQVNTEKKFLAAALSFCNGLSTQFQADRVSIGWLEGGYIRLRAISRTEKFDRHMVAARALEVAMEECLDQDDEVLWPAPEGSTVVSRDHEAFVKDQKAGHILSLPLRIDSEPIAVATCERLAAPFNELEVQQLRLCCDQISRRLSERKQYDKWFGARWASGAKEFGAKMVGPDHTWAKILVLFVSLLLAIFLFVKVDYRVEGNFILRSDEVAILTVPFKGFIDDVKVRPGDLVESGEVLLSLDTADLELRESAALADLNRYTRETEKARAAEKLAEMRIAVAQAAQAQAKLDLVRYQLEQATIKAPFAGVVVEGDLREQLGRPVEQGDPLVKVARIDNLYVEAKVDQRDVHEILERGEGEIAFVTQPNLKFPIKVDRLVPMGIPEKEKNMFIVRCSFMETPESWWRPGMSGLCKLQVEKRTLVWIFTHRTVDFLRMFFWW